MVAVATDDSLALDTLAASLRADTDDLKIFVEVLAQKLTDALPGRVVVQRKGLRGRSRPVRRLELIVGESRFELDNDQGLVQTRRRALVRGVALSTEELPLDAGSTSSRPLSSARLATASRTGSRSSGCSTADRRG